MQKYLVNTWDGQRVKENRKEGLCEGKNDNQNFFFFFFFFFLSVWISNFIGPKIFFSKIKVGQNFLGNSKVLKFFVYHAFSVEKMMKNTFFFLKNTVPPPNLI